MTSLLSLILAGAGANGGVVNGPEDVIYGSGVFTDTSSPQLTLMDFTRCLICLAGKDPGVST